jgi:hypothetical protein
MESTCHHCGFSPARKPGCRAVTYGSRNGVHTMSGSFRSSGLPTP